MSNQDILDKLSALVNRIDSLESQVKEIKEKFGQQGVSTQEEPPLGETDTEPQAGAIGGTTNENITTASTKVPSQELDHIKESFHRVALPPHLKLVDSAAGIKQGNPGKGNYSLSHGIIIGAKAID